MTKRPNVLLIVFDQFRGDLLDGRLSETANLKNLSAIAEQSCAFRRHFTVATPCGPSRVSLYTGQYAMNHRAVRNGTPLRHDTPNLAREMRAAGYDPLLFGHTDATHDPRALAEDDPRLRSYEELLPGFTEAVRQRQESDDGPWRDMLRAKGYDVPDGMDLYIPDGDTIDAPAIYSSDDSDSAYITDRFLDRMDGEPQGWFATLNYIRPHPPLVAPAPYNKMFDAAEVPAPIEAEGNAIHPFVAAVRDAKPVSSTVKGFPDLQPTPETVNTLRALYLGLAAEVDYHIGRVVDWMKTSGRWDDTILVVTADHGEVLGDYGVWGKDTFHDAAFHVPLLVHVPGNQPRKIEAMTESIDVAPTILDFAGQQAPDSMNGTSLRTLIESGVGGKAVTFSENDFSNPVEPTALQRNLDLPSRLCNLAVLRTDTHRLVQFAGPLQHIVYDMTASGERRDISGLPGFEAISLELSQQMLRHRMTHPESTFARTIIGGEGVKRGFA